VASKEFDNNCINCLHRTEKTTCPHCTKCLTNCTDGSNFPGWAPESLKAI
jgi:hypothetical protein